MQIEPSPTLHHDPLQLADRRGLPNLHTGEGKGQCSAPFGLSMRAHGHSKAARKFQFMKVPSARFGVHRLFEQIGLPIKGLEDGFGWKIHDVENSAQLAREGWTKAKASRLSGDSFGVVLHELTNSLIDGWLPLRDMLDALRARPLSVHVCITGRRCPEELIGMADTVTEMRKIKCAYGAGSPVRCGIED